MINDSLKVTEAESAANATAPRVTLESMQDKIEAAYYSTGDEMFRGVPGAEDMSHLTICVLKMKNGFFVIGEAAPASPANFDRDLGCKFAYENAIRQLWKLEGYALREELSRDV